MTQYQDIKKHVYECRWPMNLLSKAELNVIKPRKGSNVVDDHEGLRQRIKLGGSTQWHQPNGITSDDLAARYRNGFYIPYDNQFWIIQLWRDVSHEDRKTRFRNGGSILKTIGINVTETGEVKFQTFDITEFSLTEDDCIEHFKHGGSELPKELLARFKSNAKLCHERESNYDIFYDSDDHYRHGIAKPPACDMPDVNRLKYRAGAETFDGPHSGDSEEETRRRTKECVNTFKFKPTADDNEVRYRYFNNNIALSADTIYKGDIHTLWQTGYDISSDARSRLVDYDHHIRYRNGFEISQDKMSQLTDEDHCDRYRKGFEIPHDKMACLQDHDYYTRYCSGFAIPPDKIDRLTDDAHRARYRKGGEIPQDKVTLLYDSDHQTRYTNGHNIPQDKMILLGDDEYKNGLNRPLTKISEYRARYRNGYDIPPDKMQSLKIDDYFARYRGGADIPDDRLSKLLHLQYDSFL